MNKRYNNILLIVLFAISLALNTLLISLWKDFSDEKVIEKHSEKFYYVQDYIMQTDNKLNLDKKIQRAEKVFDVNVIGIMYKNDLNDVNLNEKYTNLMLNNFRNNAIYQVNLKDEIIQYVPIEKGNKGLYEFTYDNSEYKHELQENNFKYTMLIVSLTSFHILIYFIVLIILNGVQSIFEIKNVFKQKEEEKEKTNDKNEEKVDLKEETDKEELEKKTEETNKEELETKENEKKEEQDVKKDK